MKKNKVSKLLSTSYNTYGGGDFGNKHKIIPSLIISTLLFIPYVTKAAPFSGG